MMITIDEDLCKGCGYCIEICPVEFLIDSKKINKKGYKIPEKDQSNSCTYCRRCELICPEMAIKVEKEEK
ncbi:MAG: ferredoxin family protein [Candidatus Thorarchaeota archaeon]